MSIKVFKSDYISHPLKYIILAAMILRLVSAFFAKGYGMHDDHFLVIESSYSWVKGYDYNHWLPSDDGSTPQPSGHSFFYPALHFLTFSALDKMGIASLDAKMYIIRILHALFSLLTVFFAYKLTFRASGDRKTANLVGWTTAILWCLPWLSVRNLVEIFCIPFLLGSTWFYVRKEEKPSIGDVIISGLLMGCAFSVRFQVIFFIGGFGLAMLIYKRWRDAVLWSVAVIAAVCLTQISDLFVWGEPFVELREYVNYNFFHSGDYLSGSFFKYFGVLLGLLAPPLSVLLLFGFFYGFRRLFLFLPAFCFLLFHSLFPNKQERFIFPIIPSVLILGFVGCYDFYQKYKEKRGRQLLKTFKVVGIISLVINLILPNPVTVHTPSGQGWSRWCIFRNFRMLNRFWWKTPTTTATRCSRRLIRATTFRTSRSLPRIRRSSTLRRKTACLMWISSFSTAPKTSTNALPRLKQCIPTSLSKPT
jgi:hypothetical protein